ncbi:hypothetical protein RCL_jg6330.t1 [Rhizophagus clarus]|uniref:RRM domain-containing protein n=1 Tax=Rhizophagus clarus TaxID=94130 RepID=A0A8H3QJX0_9GLOM|nr:hypothetical protein RCL_jg6330.t1 [Rhizophagus clarus]
MFLKSMDRMELCSSSLRNTKTRTETVASRGLAIKQNIVDDTYTLNSNTNASKRVKNTIHKDDDSNITTTNSNPDIKVNTDTMNKQNSEPLNSGTFSNNTPSLLEYNQRLPLEPSLVSLSKCADTLESSIHCPHMIINPTNTPNNIEHDQINTNSHTNTINPPIGDDDQLQKNSELGTSSQFQISKQKSVALPRFHQNRQQQEKNNHVEIIKIGFVNKTSRNSLYKVLNKKYNITFYNYDRNILDTQINAFNKDKEARTIKVIKVPTQFTVKHIHKIFSTYGQIKNIFQHFKRSNNNQNRNQNNNTSNRQKQRPQYYNTFFIEYANQSTTRKFFEEDIWMVKVDHYLLKILHQL